MWCSGGPVRDFCYPDLPTCRRWCRVSARGRWAHAQGRPSARHIRAVEAPYAARRNRRQWYASYQRVGVMEAAVHNNVL